MSTSSTSQPTSVSNASPPPPPYKTSLANLKNVLELETDKTVLDHCLGLEMMKDAPALADSMVVVCFDTESWVRNHDKLTEIGIATFDSRDMHVLRGAGMHGQNILENVYFYHARIEENAHLVNIRFCPGNPDSNRFGQTRYLNSDDAGEMLRSVFQWPIDTARPELGFCPVVVMGHAVRGDLNMLSQTLNVDPGVFSTVVKTIDTQNLCREVGFWTDRNQAGLARLVSMCNFAYRDPHTACNDAAMTLICAIQMVLPEELKTARDTDISPDSRSLQDVVDNIEKTSQGQHWCWGTAKYCTRCGRRGHTQQGCRMKVKCSHCSASKAPNRQRAARGHATKNCIFFALRGPEEEQAVDTITERVGLMGQIGVDH